ncbi:MAG TPA: arginase family protein [Candidatus Limnocylindria bacterium]|jgi:agmatinase
MRALPSGGRRVTAGSFLGLPRVEPATMPAGAADAAILGIPHGVSYPDPGLTAGCAEAPAAIRARSQRLAPFVGNHDFDLDGPTLPPDSAFRLVDAGDVDGRPDDGPGNLERAEAAVASLLAAGVVPLVLGGDDSIPIPVLRAYAGHGPLTVLQVDAHLDFRHEVEGVREGYSSPMRRAAELGHVGQIVQVGLRGVGSARPEDVADARQAGNLLVTARELGERGVPWLTERLAADASVFVAFDCDGLDPAVLPAVSGTAPGGLTYDQAADLLGGVATRCRVVGAAFTELVPSLDTNGLSSLVVVRLLMRLVGAMARR